MKWKKTKNVPQAGISPELVARARAGEQAALSALYEQSSAALYQTVRSMVRDEDLAWDILQDSYLRAFRSLEKLESDEAFLPWLRRIAVNVTADELSRKRPLSFTDLGDGEELPEIPDPDLRVRPELALEQKERARLLREILAALPEEQQMIVGMYYYEDMPVKEIAETLRIAPGTVKSQLHWGRKKVEAAVRALEKQGVKLYGLSPLPFLLALLGRLEPGEAQEKALAKTLSRAAAAGGGAAVRLAAPTWSQFFLRGVVLKLLAGAAAVALLAAGGKLAYDAVKTLRTPEIGDVQPTAAVSAAPEPTASSAVPETPAPESSAAPEVERPPLKENAVYYRAVGFFSAPRLYAGAFSNDRGVSNVVCRLIDDYDVVSTDQEGRYVVNRSVCEAMEEQENDDGSRTVTVTLRQGLCYNTGEPITAVDYLVSALMDFSPVTGKADDYQTKQRAGYFAGAEAYLAGESDTISGLKLLDDRRYSVTIPAEAAELYYDRANVSLRPVYAAQYGAAVEVVGDQVRLTGLTAEGFNDGCMVNVGRVCAGPYQIESYSEETDKYGEPCPRLVLGINERYEGNFEGQKPQVETVVIALFKQETSYEFLPQDEASYFSCLTDGDMIRYYQGLADAGLLTGADYPRSGYGYLMYQCDLGPTQFRAVRQAVACLIDRESYAKLYCQDYGAAVHGPYDTSRWEYRANAAELEAELDPYAYDPARAVELLEADGWVLAEDGSAYVSGLRYKQVTPEEAGSYPYVVTLADGSLLMPLRIDRAAAATGSGMDSLVGYLDENQAITDAGMQIVSVELSFGDLLNYLYRDTECGEQYAGSGNSYGLYNLAVNLEPRYDFSSDFVEAYSVFHYDCGGELARLSREMLLAPDDAAYAELWRDFVLEWNAELPYVPLYQNTFYDFMDVRIQGLTPNCYWPFERAVLYASVERPSEEP